MGFLDKLFGKSNKEEQKVSNLKIGIVLGSVREGRNAEAVTNYVYDFATKRNDNVDYEIVDLAEYKLPLMGAALLESEQADAQNRIKAWSDKMASFDGYIFVAPEYNHAVGGALKNATDYLKPEVANKVAGFVGYGSLGGTRAHENLRLILAELQVADVRTAVTFSLITDFENMSVFKPAAYHEANINQMLDEVKSWGTAFKSLRA
ncbi:NADPH-dependent oxidoreductase [Oceanobacillus sp. 143]|jgi:NAD(P)H-dependent FMN reductase|uniref:NADPH-dependent oxidoreductase n=1 Tax=Oceanobacillus zhaokaii TaxID=2052660 RepID=A0A345PLF9_9BACI|nr:NAD(P)H-dependent oxidoreductase [Oceanobacillus zhaokaii]AXI10839.1 NADPH-dependent oxidoreductase [Oceanobacillus zhaokaii]QGS69720.1 NADPH-dependent oxidoreductase [Oceanobacillus sp. 143]